MRRLPHALTALEAAARKVSIEAPREERKWYQMPVFWLGLIGGGLLVLVFGPRSIELAPQPAPEPARIEEPMDRAPSPSATATIPPSGEAAPPASGPSVDAELPTP
jgi:hypothetical protein